VATRGLNKENKVGFSVIIAFTIFVLVGFIVTNTMIQNLPPNNFVIVNKEIKEAKTFNFFGLQGTWDSTEYRIFYGNGTDQFLLTTKDAYMNYQIGDVFNGPVFFEG
jgi:hypothetical protein